MDLQIVNAATGDATIAAGVTSQNELSCRATTVTAIHEATLAGNAYAWNSVSADLVAGDTALLIGNESKTKLLVIHSCYISCDLATQVDFHLPAYPSWAGAAVTGVNLNKASTNVAAATAYTDETGNSIGSIILTGYQPVATAGQATTAVPVTYNFDDAIILAEHDCFGADVVGETVARFECTIIGYFIDK